jgi:hypothetical protein
VPEVDQQPNIFLVFTGVSFKKIKIFVNKRKIDFFLAVESMCKKVRAGAKTS